MQEPETEQMTDVVTGETPTESPAETRASEAHPSGMDEGARDYITALQAELEEARSRADEAEKRLVYSQAEFANASRRKDEQHKADQRFATSKLIEQLLPVIDNFERALKAAEQSQSFDKLVNGISGIQKQLQSALQKAGVNPIEVVGQEFDPNFHEAIGHAEDSEYEANIVAEEVQRGYMMHDRVLRPALVKVSQGKSA